MKITKSIKPNKFTKLFQSLLNKFGFPTYHEEMVIYLSKNNVNIKIAVKSNSGATLSYRDRFGKQIAELYFNSEELKNILTVIRNIVGNKGHISISPIFEFATDDFLIRLINNSFIGSIITVVSSASPENILYEFNEYILKANKSTKPKLEKIIDFEMGERGVLNEKIISYIERNGIYLNRNKRTTYKDVLESKSNDYSVYSDIFKTVTGHNLLSKKSLSLNNLPNLNSIFVSIIIPCYNTENTIKKVLDSIKYQYKKIKLRKLEIILIDNGSIKPISSFVSINDYPFTIQIVRLEKNSGASNARHIGVTISSGDILIFIDSDVLLEKNYLKEHLIRNLIIPNAVFVSFKENVVINDPRISNKQIYNGLELPNYSKDLRIYKRVKKDAIGSYKVEKDTEVEILESTNYFKSFSGSRVFGIYDLSCMVIGHNFSARKKTILNSSPFTYKITGWGMEDVYSGLKLINNGNFIIPVLSTGVYHIDHPPRSGNNKKKIDEYKQNTEIINKILNTEIKEGIISDDFLKSSINKKKASIK